MPRNRHRLRAALLLAGLIGALGASALFAQRIGESVEIREPVEHDLYAAGRGVYVLAPVAGDLVAAAQRVSVEADVEGDVIAAGETVSLWATVLDDVRAVGREVVLAGQVGDHMVAAGETVRLEPAARVGSWAWLAGSTVDVAGAVGGELRIGAATARVRGEVGGDLQVRAETVEIADTARVHGDLIWYGERAPTIGAGARIDGRVLQRPGAVPAPGAPGAAAAAAAAAVFAAGLMVAGVVLYLLFPGFALAAVSAVHAAPWRCLGLGLAGLAATPLVVVLLFVTAVGYLLGLALLAVYLVALLVGGLLGALVLGDAGLRSLRRLQAGRWLRAASIVLAIVVMGLVQWVPILGPLVVLALLLAGLGALQLLAYRAYTGAGGR